MINTFLVGTDFSPGSDRAFLSACRLAQTTGGRVHLLHILEPVDEPGSSDPETTEFYESLTKLSLGKLASQMERNKRDVVVEHSVMIGRRDDCLLKAAKTMKVEMTVLGSVPLTSGSRGFGISHRVAVSSDRPVLLVP